MRMKVAAWIGLATVTAVAVAAEGAGQIETVAGTGQNTDSGTAGQVSEMNIGNPFGVEFGPDGWLYVTEVDNHRLRRIDLASGRVETVAGTGEQGYSGDGGPATQATLDEPYEVRFDSAGNIYFVERLNHIVRRIDAETGVITTVAGTGEAGFNGDDRPATEAQLHQPHSIVLDEQAGQLYIADIRNHRIRRVDLGSNTITTVAGNGEREMPVDGAEAAGRPMIGPRALYLRDGVLWIALREGHSFWTLDLESGRLRHIGGTGERGYSGDGGPAKEATFNGPKGIALDEAGNLYIVDTENQAIRRIDAESGKVTTIAGSGERGYGGDGGPATQAKLDRPHGICVGPDGHVYIGDSETHRVRRVVLAADDD